MRKAFSKQTILHLAFAAGLTVVALLAGAARAETGALLTTISASGPPP